MVRPCSVKTSSDVFTLISSPFLNLNGLSSLICCFSSIIHVFYYHFFVTPFLICAPKHYFSVPLPVNFLICTWHYLSFYLSLPLSPITCNNHTHFHILPSAVSLRRPWAAGCWLASVLMIWRSRTPALGINGLCRTTTGPSTHTRPHTQMPRRVIDGQWESQPLQT